MAGACVFPNLPGETLDEATARHVRECPDHDLPEGPPAHLREPGMVLVRALDGGPWTHVGTIAEGATPDIVLYDEVPPSVRWDPPAGLSHGLPALPRRRWWQPLIDALRGL